MSNTDGEAGGRSCIFCGGRPITGEHAWPQWIAKYLSGEKLTHLAVVETEGREPSVQLRGERVPFTTKINCVCKPCNEGWMHELETSAELILAGPIQGKPVVWHEWRQVMAAAWAFKTAIVLEQGQAPEHRAIPAEILPLFRQFLRPPPYSQIWTALYSGEFPHSFSHGKLRLVLTTPEGVAVPNDLEAYGVSLHVGAIAFRIFGHLIRDGPANVPQADFARRLVPIWPVVPRAEWPPALAVDDNGMELLVKSMGEVVLGPTTGQRTP